MSLIIINNLHNNRNRHFTCYSGLRFKLLFSMCDEKDSRKRTTRASILAANRAASSSSESEEVGHAISYLFAYLCFTLCFSLWLDTGYFDFKELIFSASALANLQPVSNVYAANGSHFWLPAVIVEPCTNFRGLKLGSELQGTGFKVSAAHHHQKLWGVAHLPRRGLQMTW